MRGRSERGVEATDDPRLAMAGFGPVGVSVEPGEIDEIVYGH